MSRAGALAIGLALSPVLGCGTESAPEQELVDASHKVGFGDIANLGPHRLEASIQRAVIIDGVRRDQGKEQVQLVWRDWDNFQLARRRNGVIISQVLVEQGSARVRQSDGRLEPAADVEPHRVELRMAWDVWSLGLSVFDGMIAFEHVDDSQLDGRTASRYTVSLLPDPAGHSRTIPDSLEGTVWIDETTAVRLMAEVVGRWHQAGREQQVNEVEIVLVRTDFGLAGASGAWGT